MPQNIKKGANALVAEAMDGLPEITVEEAIPLVDAGTHVFVDVREGSEQAKGRDQRSGNLIARVAGISH